MKRLTLLIILMASGLCTKSFADEKKTVKSTLQTATVFFQGAELAHKASSNLTKGENEIWIDGLSPNIDRNSLKINATNGAIVTSYEYSIDYLNPKSGSLIEKKLQDSITIYGKQMKDAEVKLKTNADLLGLLQANKSIAGTQNGLSVSELMKMMDYYQAKSIELQNEKRNLDELSEKAGVRIAVLQNQLAQESSKNTKASGVLKLKLTSPNNTPSDFTITYYTASSGWTPYYDINVSGTDKPIKMASKAKVRQTTGLDWSRVKLTLSTSAPSRGKVAPLFNAWFLNFQSYGSSPIVAMGAMKRSAAVPMAQNTYSYNMDVAEVLSVEEEKEVMQPQYLVDGVYMSAGDFANIDSNMIKSIDNSNSNLIIVTLKSSMDDFISRDENQLSMVYNIDLPYTIEGNGKEQIIDLQTIDVNAEFSYYSAPKLDTETFLLAEISDWQKLGLLSGKANVTYDGTYVGETVIDAGSTLSKLGLTLGTDKRIAVKREKMQDFSSKKFLGNDIKQEFVYQITVKNNQTKTIKMVLKDQYPLSSQKDIEVELLKETTDTTHKNEAVGVLVWEFELKPGETQVFKTAYSVKYPKGKTLNL